MTTAPSITFAKLDAPKAGTAVILVGAKLEMGGVGAALEKQSGKALARIHAVQKISGQFGSSCEILAPTGTTLDKLVYVGVGDEKSCTDHHWLRLGGIIAGKLTGGVATIVMQKPSGEALHPDACALVALGIRLRLYKFDKYKTIKKDDSEKSPHKITLAVASPLEARRAFERERAVAEGVDFARDLVNEPANVLGPVEFAAELKKLAALGVDVSVLTEREMKKLGMGALLGVAQGSVRMPRMVIMKWKGGKAKDKPLALVGKGVVFDTGGISIKPAQGMEDMKADMAGAAAVAGLMKVLAGRGAKANVIGCVGLVENMPDGNAQRPGDIVTSMSGQTIEIINTDAEGRLVLADALTYVQEQFQPKAVIDLATLTGAIVVALGHEHAGLFSNDDQLAKAIEEAAGVSGEKVWRMPLSADYDKIMDSKVADMKNAGGRYAGAISAAQFLQRFISNTPWAHIDIAGTAIDSPATDTNRSWSSGFGVRLLDCLVRQHYEG